MRAGLVVPRLFQMGFLCGPGRQPFGFLLETKNLLFEGNDQTRLEENRDGRNALPKLQKEIDGDDRRQGPDRPAMLEVR
jgi:hypothetical protein